jgi:hypothetical protein
VTDRIRSFIEARWLDEHSAPDDEVAGLWLRALGAFADAHVQATTEEARVIRAYDAGRFAATAVVRAHNLRIRAQNHHEVVIRSAGVLGGAELQRSLNAFERLKGMRAKAEYGWENSPYALPLSHGLELVRRILDLTALELRTERPGIAERITLPET